MSDKPRNYALDKPSPDYLGELYHVRLPTVRIHGEIGTVALQQDNTWSSVTSYDTPSKHDGFATREDAVRRMLECYTLTLAAQMQAAEKALIELDAK